MHTLEPTRRLHHVWVLRIAGRGEESPRDLRSLVALRVQLFARVPKLHAKECLSVVMYDARLTNCVAEIGRAGRADPSRALVSPMVFQAALRKWDERREGFHRPMNECTVALENYPSS
jgi:hypothetical protein